MYACIPVFNFVLLAIAIIESYATCNGICKSQTYNGATHNFQYKSIKTQWVNT